MKKILAIGNSFSEDATAYLHQIAATGGVDTKVVNLFIGGCSLETHWKNCQGNLQDYVYQINGEITQRMVSVEEVLMEDSWDFITMQQASHESGILQSYVPYLKELSGYVRERCGGAKQLLHQTWAYETDSAHDRFYKYNNNQQVMYLALKAAYEENGTSLGLPLIPCGDVIQALRETPRFDYPNGGQTLCRDGFHMHLVYGRYAAAATWYEAILKENILENDFVPPGALPEDKPFLALIRETVHRICAR